MSQFVSGAIQRYVCYSGGGMPLELPGNGSTVSHWTKASCEGHDLWTLELPRQLSDKQQNKKRRDMILPFVPFFLAVTLRPYIAVMQNSL